MKLTILSSSSSANGYVIQSEKEAIVLECGCPFIMCEKAVHFNISKIAGCLVSHEHGDHAKYINDYARYLPVYATQGTWQKVGECSPHYLNVLQPLKQTKVGNFTVLAFPTQHDAKEPCGFLISHKDFGGCLLFATDTYYVKYKFANLAYIMIECNYEEKKLQGNVDALLIPPSVAARVRKSHMSLHNCIALLQANDLSKVKGIFLLHLSQNNSNPISFLQSVQSATGKYVAIATKWLEIELM